MSQTTQNIPQTVPPAVVTTAAEPPVVATEPSDDEAHLQSIFPDLDAATIHDCYVLCDRNVERTVEFLLGDASTSVTNAPGGMSQGEIDENLARQLEQEELSAAAAAAGNTRAWSPRQAPAAAPPQPASLRSSQTAPPDGPDLQEQFNKIAETGKRTFNTIFNKVKERLKEFEQPAPGSTAASSQSYYGPSGATAVEPPFRAAPSPYHAAALGPPASGEQRTTTESSINPSGSAATTTTTAPSAPPSIDVSKAAFLAKKPTPLTETAKPHPEEDLTENPFDDRTH